MKIFDKPDAPEYTRVIIYYQRNLMADTQTNPQTQASTPLYSGVNTDITGAFPTQAPSNSVVLPEMNLESEIENTLTEVNPETVVSTETTPKPEVQPLEKPAFEAENSVQPEIIPSSEPSVMPTNESDLVPEPTLEITPEEATTTEPEIIDDSQDEIISEAQSSLDTLVDPVTNTETLSEESNLNPEESNPTSIENIPEDQVFPESEAITVPESIIPSTHSESSPDDPFDGLNIVFDEPKKADETPAPTPSTDQIISNTQETSIQAETETQAFVDPFLSKKEEVTTSTEPDNQTNLDTMLETLTTTAPATTNADMATNSLTSTISNKIGGLDGKKKKMLLVGSGVLGLAVLAGASYMVFSTMFPSDNIGNQLQADINGPVVETGNENTDTPVLATGSDDVLGTLGTDENSIPEEEVGIPSDSFGDEDQLPDGATIPDTTPTDTSSDEEELTANVSPENDTALKTLDEQVDKLKQLLSLAKSKNDNAAIKQIALTLKSIRSVKEKII